MLPQGYRVALPLIGGPRLCHACEYVEGLAQESYVKLHSFSSKACRTSYRNLEISVARSTHAEWERKINLGCITSVMGPSGAGKTSFLSALAGKAIGCRMSGVILINGGETHPFALIEELLGLFHKITLCMEIWKLDSGRESMVQCSLMAEDAVDAAIKSGKLTPTNGSLTHNYLRLLGQMDGNLHLSQFLLNTMYV
ncbi:hypothetical protein Tsubulata_044709 [Turnera subulata]|uniref:ABC transporter domain-containing protein n=1 Tax=Turnera subulata TaxID=218843 RepID=A0A9Q0G8C0_9ROSI|nr:hypothetical protein Tsubulata_044709 [Turnera subulata]